MRRKLTTNQAISVLRDPRSDEEVAEELGVSEAAIGFIRTGRSYANVAPEIPRRGKFWATRPAMRYKLSPDQVIAILTDGRSIREIAGDHHVNDSTVSAIQLGLIHRDTAPTVPRRGSLRRRAGD